MGGGRFDSCYIAAVAAERGDPCVLLVAAHGFGFHRTPCRAEGLFRSSDAGRTWRRVLRGAPSTIVPDPRKPDVRCARVLGRGI